MAEGDATVWYTIAVVLLAFLSFWWLAYSDRRRRRKMASQQAEVKVAPRVPPPQVRRIR